MFYFQDHISSNHSGKREVSGRAAAGGGKKDSGKSTKKAGMSTLPSVYHFIICIA